MGWAERRLTSASLPPFTREGHQTEVTAEGQVEGLSRGDDRDRNGRASQHLHSAIAEGGEDPEGTVSRQFEQGGEFQKVKMVRRGKNQQELRRQRQRPQQSGLHW